MPVLPFGPSTENGPSIHDHIAAHIEPSGQLSEPGFDLPDDDPADAHWGLGAKDNLIAHHVMREDRTTAVDAIYDALRKRIAHPRSRKAWQHLYDTMCANTALPNVDSLLERLMASPLPAGGLHETGRLLATTAVHRDPVKYGIAMVGLTGGPADRELLHVLGRHDEFSLYSAVALEKVSQDWETELWQLATHVHGFGRAHLVNRLKDTTRADIRRWLLLRSIREEFAAEHIALTAAVTGGLLEALAGDPDEETLNAACDIVQTLILAGDYQIEGMSAYEDGADAVLRLMRHLSRRASHLRDLVFTEMVREYVAMLRPYERWTPELLAEVSELCVNLIAEDRWPPMVREALLSTDRLVFELAPRAAAAIGMDGFDLASRRVLAAPSDPDSWWDLMQCATDANIDRIAALAVDRLQDEPLGDEDEHPVLEILWTLNSFPGKGGPLLVQALRSPNSAHRSRARGVLVEWDRDQWPAEVETALRAALETEHDTDQRASLTELLAHTEVRTKSEFGRARIRY